MYDPTDERQQESESAPRPFGPEPPSRPDRLEAVTLACRPGEVSVADPVNTAPPWPDRSDGDRDDEPEYWSFADWAAQQRLSDEEVDALFAADGGLHVDTPLDEQGFADLVDFYLPSDILTDECF